MAVSHISCSITQHSLFICLFPFIIDFLNRSLKDRLDRYLERLSSVVIARARHFNRPFCSNTLARNARTSGKKQATRQNAPCNGFLYYGCCLHSGFSPALLPGAVARSSLRAKFRLVKEQIETLNRCTPQEKCVARSLSWR